MLGTGIRGAGILATALQGPGPLGLPPLDFAAGAFTAGLAKRATTTFAASPLVQGKWDGTGTPDVLSLSRGTLIGNPTGFLYTNFDPYQGSIAFWITPEWAGNDGVLHAIFSGADGSSVRIYKSDTNRIYMRAFGTSLMSVDVSGWAVGARHFVVCRWDFKNTLDGTNYCAVSVDDVHTYGATTLPTITTLTSTLGVGSYNSTYGADAVIEGLTVYRRPLWDGAYGKDLGNGDEINLMHAAGAGADPCLITGSWDVVFCLPTNSATGSLVTGTGCAWSHPHESMVLTKSMFSDGGYLGAAAAVAYNGTTTTGNAGSGATLDDLPAGGNIIQIEAWIRYDATTALYREIIHKTNTPTQTTGWVVDVNSADRIYFNVNLATTDATATGLAARTVRDGKWHHIACA